MVMPAAVTKALPNTPALVTGYVRHTRRERLKRKFQHKTYQWLVDLDSIPRQPWYLRPFTSFSAHDHLGDPELSIKENIEYYLAVNNINLGPQSRILMLANARILGYTFDPLSVFWCLDSKENVQCVLAEVRNTYGQRHVYLLRPDSHDVARSQKKFHVSPFFDVSGEYEMKFTLTSEAISTTVTLLRGEKVAFTATFQGKPVPATKRAIFLQLLLHPFITQQISLLIRVHGIWLWIKRLPVFQLPHHDLQEGV